MILMLALACSTAPPAPVRSEPAPPRADFGNPPPGPPKVVVTALTQVFERGVVGPPKVLGSVRIGMPRDEAVQQLRATAFGEQPVMSRAVEGIEHDSVLHVIDPPVRLFVLSQGGAVIGIDVGLPFEQATLALDDLWGPAKPGPTLANGKVTHLWTGPDWTARLAPLPDPTEPVPPAMMGRGLLELRPTS